MHKVQAHDDESSASGSGVADLNSLENGTDTLGREIMQYERDSRRIRNATRGDQQPLLKTRTRPRVTELIARREREEGLVIGQQHESTGSTGSNERGQSSAMARHWGVHAKPHRGWMNRIREPSEADVQLPGDRMEPRVSGVDDVVVKTQRLSEERDDFWRQEDERLPLMESTPPSMKRPRPNSQPVSRRDANSTIKQIIESEDQEFSELSLLASTPAAARPARVGRGFDQRHDSSSHRRPRSAWLSERSMNRATEFEKLTTSEDEPIYSQKENIPRPASTSNVSDRPVRRRAWSRNNGKLAADDNVSSHPNEREGGDISERTSGAVKFQQQKRPSQANNRSLGLLNRLAVSLSPSPGKPSLEASHAKTEQVEPQDQPKERRETASSNLYGDRSSRRASSRTSENTEEDAPKEEKAVVVDTRTSGQRLSKDSRPLLRSSDSAVVRAFGTSAREHEPTEERETNRTEDILKKLYDGTIRPQSALEDILREAKRDPDGPFGDGTIQSLEGIVFPNVDASDNTLTLDASATKESDAIDDLGIDQLTQAERQRRQEDLAIEGLAKHLRSAYASIKDAERGIGKLENKVETSTLPEAPKPATMPSKPRGTVNVDQNWRTVCDHCGGCYQSVWAGLWTEFRSNFYVYDKNARYGIRLTWLGLLVILWFIWHIVENLLCFQYCHPMYADTMEGYGVDPDAPRYPFVIPTMLFRPLRPIWKPILQSLQQSYTAAFHMVFGEPPKPRQPRFMDPDFKFTPEMIRWDAVGPLQRRAKSWDSGWPVKAAATAAAAAARVTSSFVDAVDEMGFMTDDEFL